MKVVVAFASKYGFTRGIAESIAYTMRSIGVEAEAKEVDHVDGVGGYDAFVIGSAVFFGKWMKEAHEFVTRNQGLLRPGRYGCSAVDRSGLRPKPRKDSL